MAQTQESLPNPEQGFEHTDYKSKNMLAENIINASIDSLIALNRNLEIISWNKITEAWSGLIQQDVMGKPFFDVIPSAREMPDLQEALQKALDGVRTYLPSGPSTLFKGSYEMHFVPLYDEAQHIYGVLQIVHDVTHRVGIENQLKRLNEELRAQYAALQHANEEMETFARIASNDLKEPLRSIYGYSETIKVREAKQLSDSGKGNFRRIQQSVQRMGLLTDDIVNYLSLSGSEQADEVDLSQTLSEAIAHFEREIQETVAKITASPLPVVKGDKKSLVLLMRQVLGNALKFRRKEVQPEITITHSELAGSDLPFHETRPHMRYHCLAFRDNGIGFDESNNEKIFGLFTKLHHERTYRGTGMGLALALKVARRHQGYMKASGVAGEGCTIYCYLPITDHAGGNGKFDLL